MMAQTPQSEETGGTGDTAATGAASPQGLFGSSTTILLIVFAVAVFWWNRRRRVAMEEQLRAQRLEAEATAERSALDVANLMRAAPRPGERAAAASEGLASASQMPSALAREPATEDPAEARTIIQAEAPDPVARAEAGAREIERAEARAAAERAAEEQAARAARGAHRTGESVERRMAAASAAADEAAADTTDAAQLGQIAAVPVVGTPEREAADAQDANGEPRFGSALPAGAVAGNGTAVCPPNYPIKGNRQSRIYHRPGQVSYPSTVAEYCFATEEAAESAGFRQSRARGQRTQPR
jgi:cytoskeletal protein RodZ